jgi:hypothetical protein
VKRIMTALALILFLFRPCPVAGQAGLLAQAPAT